MYYRLKEPYAFRGWKKLPYAIRAEQGEEMQLMPSFFGREDFHYLLYLNGEEHVDSESLPESARAIIDKLIEKGMAEVSETPLPPLEPWQRYKVYPSALIEKVHWAVTGKCNMCCRHCLVSAPDHHQPQLPLEDLRHIADEIAACGVRNIDITGGEPLVRDDFAELVRIVSERDLVIRVMFTNGSLLDEQILKTLEEYGQKPIFQISFDGLEHHDWLRGVPGSEEKTAAAFRLLSEHGYNVAAAMMIHRGNKDSLMDTANYLASLGVRALRTNAPQELGIWRQYSEEYALSEEEIWEVYKDFIPRYFEAGMPIDVDLDGYFSCRKGSTDYRVQFGEHNVTADDIGDVFYCGAMHSGMHIRPDGRVVPCMGLSDSVWGDRMPSVLEDHLWDISIDPRFRDLADTKVSALLEKNPECRDCEHLRSCTGGCLVQDMSEDGDYLIPDHRVCWFFKHIGVDAVKEVADAAIKKYCPELSAVDKTGK